MASEANTPAEARALRIAALLAAAAIVWVAHPVGIGVLLGTLTAFTLRSFYFRLCKRWKRPSVAALFCVAVTTLGFLFGMASFGYLLIGRGIELVRALGTLLQPGGAARTFVEQLNGRLPRLGIHAEMLVSRIGNATAEISVRLAGLASVVAGTTLSGLLALFFLIVTSYYVLQNWNMLIRHAEIMLPLNPRDTRALLEEFRRVGQSVLLGTVLTGIAQGVLAGIGYFITGVPEAAFFGALTAIASFLPMVGTLLIWVPLGIYLLISHHVGWGIAELLYGSVVVVGLSDYVLRPLLVGRHGRGPALLTLIALFGGLEAFGLIGLIFGPVVMSLSLALLRIYEREAAHRRIPELDSLDATRGLDSDGSAVLRQ